MVKSQKPTGRPVKLTGPSIRLVRQLREQGVSPLVIAHDFDVSRATVYRMFKGYGSDGRGQHVGSEQGRRMAMLRWGRPGAKQNS